MSSRLYPACGVAFETAGDLAPGFAFSASSSGVLLGTFVAVLSSKDDASQSVVGAAVAASVVGGGWRMVRPEDVSTGLAPHRAVKAAWGCIRCGLSPATVSSVVATGTEASEAFA